MKIRNKDVIVYDIEIFPNVFHLTAKNTETQQYYFFEISERKNQLTELDTKEDLDIIRELVIDNFLS